MNLNKILHLIFHFWLEIINKVFEFFYIKESDDNEGLSEDDNIENVLDLLNEND
jgi:hypothetical protein